MSLQLHLSSRNDELLATLRPRLAAARQTTLAAGAGIPRPVPVLLPSSQLGDWLQVQLARELGLARERLAARAAHYHVAAAERLGFWLS